MDYLFSRATRQESEEWCAFSLVSAMSGMEDEEPVYTIDDIVVQGNVLVGAIGQISPERLHRVKVNLAKWLLS